MGLETIALGAGALGGIGGAIKGAKGTPAVNRLAAAGADETALLAKARQQYQQQLNQIRAQEQGISALDPLRQQALGGFQGVLGGQAFQASPEELAQIDQLRQAQIQLGTQDIQRLLGEAIGQTTASAGVRGLRGQALAQLQGQNVQSAAQQIGNVVNTAGVQAAQQAMENPYRRVAAQTPFLQQGLTYQDQLRQQAIQNRQLASNPALLGYYQGERQSAGQLNTPAQRGSIADALAGFAGGGAAAFGAVGQGAGGFGQYDYYRNIARQPGLPGSLV